MMSFQVFGTTGKFSEGVASAGRGMSLAFVFIDSRVAAKTVTP